MSKPGRDSALTENRNYPRVSSRCGLSYRPIDDPTVADDAENRAVMNNISGGGISFASTERMSLGQMLALEVSLPGFPSDVISMGKVVWCRSADSGWDIGVEFWWVGWKDEGAQNQIRQYITDRLRADG